MLDARFAVLGSVLVLAACFAYARDTFMGRSQPNRVSWLLWTAAPMIAFAAQLSKGVGLQGLLTFAASFGPLLILLASFLNKRAYWKITKFDIVCGLSSLLALLLWAMTGQGNLAILFSILADFLASVPVIVKTYRTPKSEGANVEIGSSLGAILTLLTIHEWIFANFAFALYLAFDAGLIAMLILFPTVRLTKISQRV